MRMEIAVRDKDTYRLRCDDWPGFIRAFPEISGRIYGAVLRKLKPSMPEEQQGRIMVDAGMLFMQGIDDGCTDGRYIEVADE